MGLFYSASSKELLQIRNKIFIDIGLPALEKNRFKKSPFLDIWYGKSDIGYTYELCRLSDKGELEMLEVNIGRGDMWIQTSLNIFNLKPKPNSLEQLKGLRSLNFGMPPCSISNLRLDIERMNRTPNISVNVTLTDHKIKSYFTKSGLIKRGQELGRIIENDMSNIDSFIRIWHQLHQPLVTTWEGIPCDQ